MIYWVVFGTNVIEETRGVLMDACSNCHDVAPFSVVDYFTNAHLYFVNIGSASYRGSYRSCLLCGTQFTFDPERHPEVLPVSALESVDREAALDRTTPSLRAALGDIASAREQLEEFAEAIDPDEVEAWREAMSRVETLTWAGWRTQRGAHQVANWRSLPEQERHELLNELRGYWSPYEVGGHANHALGVG